jgi:hypothetical protein
MEGLSILSETFILFYLAFNWLTCILYKNNYLPNKLDSTEIPIIQELGECKFCMDFWISTILAVIYFSYALDFNILLWGVFCSSITSLFRL